MMSVAERNVRTIKGGRIAMAVSALFATAIILSLVHPWGNPRADKGVGRTLLAGVETPAEVRDVVEAKCADCHSSTTRWPLYSRVAPISWLVERDVMAGRNALNLSKWEQYSSESKVDLLTEIASEAHSGEMPLKQYLIIHRDARLTAAEQQMLYDWAKAERKRVRKMMAAGQDKISTR